MAANRQLHDRVVRAYVTPGHAVAFSTPQRVAAHFGITATRARHILEHVEGYTLHREYKRPRTYNPYYVHKRREQVQADLIDVAKLARHNNDTRFLLLLIDIFTKRVWLYPLARKTAAAVASKMTRWLNGLDVAPDVLMTDRGNEFRGRVQLLLQRRHVEWQPALGTMKAAIAERANKTVQILMYKYLSENETLRYIDALDRLVDTYNKRGHRTLEGMSPLDADRPENEMRVQAIFHARYNRIADRTRRKRTGRLPYQVGDTVRIKTEPKKITSSSRAYAEQFHGEYFRVVRINRTLAVPLYYLRSLDTWDTVDGGFYAEELQRQRGDAFKIEDVLRERTRRGRRELLVKWKYFGPAHNSWVAATDVTRRFRRP